MVRFASGLNGSSVRREDRRFLNLLTENSRRSVLAGPLISCTMHDRVGWGTLEPRLTIFERRSVMELSHTVRSFDDDLKILNDLVTQMMTDTENQIVRALQAISSDDEKLANEVGADDGKVNDLEQQVHETATRVLALRQPLSRDLRSLIGAMRISVDLERVGDYAVNIAKRVPLPVDRAPEEAVSEMERMGHIVTSMIATLREAFSTGDSAKAVEAWSQDDLVDDLYARLITETRSRMEKTHGDGEQLEMFSHVLFMGKALERMGDHLTNVAEHIYYSVEGVRLHEVAGTSCWKQ
jgi:phosphate transport system protein